MNEQSNYLTINNNTIILPKRGEVTLIPDNIPDEERYITLKEYIEFMKQNVSVDLIVKIMENTIQNLGLSKDQFKTLKQHKNTVYDLTQEVVFGLELLTKTPEGIAIFYNNLIETQHNEIIYQYKIKLASECMPEDSVVDDDLMEQRINNYLSI